LNQNTYAFTQVNTMHVTCKNNDSSLQLNRLSRTVALGVAGYPIPKTPTHVYSSVPQEQTWGSVRQKSVITLPSNQPRWL
jgi:hypothetical protein